MHEFYAWERFSRPWLHSSTRTISHTWQTNPDKLFFNTWLMTKIQLNVFLTLGVNTLNLIVTFEITSELLKGCQNNFTHFFGKVWKSLENCWKCAEVAGAFQKLLSKRDKNLISHALINLTQKREVYIDIHVCFCIKDNHGQQEEPAILISRLLYIAIRLDFHKECMECTERTLITSVWTFYHS